MLKLKDFSRQQTLPSNSTYANIQGIFKALNASNNAPYSDIQGTFKASNGSKVTHHMLTLKEHSKHQTLPK